MARRQITEVNNTILKQQGHSPGYLTFAGYLSLGNVKTDSYSTVEHNIFMLIWPKYTVYITDTLLNEIDSIEN